MVVGYVYDAGKRDLNEDSVLFRETLFKGGTLSMACVCDGMGGMDEGAYASSFCIAKLEEFYDHILVPFTANSGGTNGYRKGVDSKVFSVFKSMNEELFNKMRREKISCGSTVTLCIIYKERYSIYHIGDSRGYQLIRFPFYGTYAKCLTKDDAKDGRLTKCIGLNTDWRPAVKRGDIGKGTLMLCSDGFYKKAGKDIMKNCLDPEKLVSEKIMEKRLGEIAEYVKKQGEADNISAIAIKRKEVSSDAKG